MSEDYHPYDHFDISPRQYHAGLDKLWIALGISGPQEKDVFTLCAEELTALRGKVEKLEAVKDAAYEYIENFNPKLTDKLRNTLIAALDEVKP